MEPNFDLDALERQRLIQQAMYSQPQQPKRGGFQPSAFISEGAGLGGAVGGAALGASIGSVVPGIGTIIGGLIGGGLGGFLGGTGGSVAEQKIRDNDVDLKKALREGALSGVGGAIPGAGRAVGVGVKALKGGGAQKALTSMRALAKKAAESGAPVVAPTAARTSTAGVPIISKQAAQKAGLSTQREAFQRTVKDWQKASGSKKLLPEVQKSLDDLARKEKLLPSYARPAVAPKTGIKSLDAQLARSQQSAAKLDKEMLRSDRLLAADGSKKAASRLQKYKAYTQAQREAQRATTKPPAAPKVATPSTPAPTAAAAPGAPTESFGASLRNQFRPRMGAISGRVEGAGQALRAQGRGVTTGLKPQGSAEKLLPSGTKRVNETLNAVGAKGSVNRQLRTVESAQQKAIAQIDKELATSNKTLLPAARAKIADNFNAAIASKGSAGGGILGMTPAHRKIATELSRRIKATNTLRGQEQLRRAIDKRIAWARNPNSPDLISEEIFKAARRSIDDSISAIAPGLKAAKTQYAALEAAKDALVQNAPATLRQSANMGVFGRLASSGTAQSALDRSGRALSRVARVSSTPAVQTAVAQQVTRAAGGGTPPPPDPTQDPNSQEFALQQLAAQGITPDNMMSYFGATSFDPATGQPINDTAGMGTGGGQPGLQGGALSGLTRSSSDLFNDAFLNAQAGNFEAAKLLSGLAAQAAEFEQAGGGGGALPADQRKAVAAGNSALAVVDEIESTFNEIGGAAGLPGVLRNVGGKLRIDQNANLYNSQKLGYLSRIARAFGEVGTLAEGDVARAANLMPDLADTPENAARKLEALRRLIGDARDRALQGGGATYGDPIENTGLDLSALGY